MKRLTSPSGNAYRLLDRRNFLAQTATGLGGIALASLLADEGLLASTAAKTPIRPEIDLAQPHAPRRSHYPAKAQRVLVIFASGACSQIDTFDYKPELIKRHGQPLPGAEGMQGFQGAHGNLTKSPYSFRPRGQSGKMISDLVGHIGDLADDLCFVHSLTSKTNTHGPGETFMSTGDTLDGYPSMGAWTSYALGSENQELPAFVAIPDPRGAPQAGGNNWGSGFLPAAFQGTPFNASVAIRNLARPAAISAERDRAAREHLQLLNQRHLQRYAGDSELLARVASYELAAKMQLSVPRITDLSTESAETLALYGADDVKNPLKAGFARNCILARRLLEQNVRFVQLFNGSYAMGEGVGNWDGHRHLKQQYDIHGPILDQPVAALVKDLKQRGMLEDTLVVFCTEFGRMPTFQAGANGRDHNNAGFTCWLAGAGVKKGFSFGATDEFSHKAVENAVEVYDFHATILHLLGLDHERLSYYHNGIERRLTNVHGHVIEDILA